MIRAVLEDTWKQSKQQAVFIVMLAIMVVALVVGIALPRPIVGDAGQKQFGTVLSDNPDQFFARQWVSEYARARMGGDDASRAIAARSVTADRNLTPEQRRERMQEFGQAQRRAFEEASAMAADVPEYRRAVEYYIHFVIGGMFKVTMLLFIAACAGYFPAMLGSGAVDIVLAKPLSRLQIYASRYLGGIVLYTAAIAVFCLLFYLGIGVRTGIFHARIFLGIPLLAFSAMVLYALLALVGTAGRSATMAMVAGYLFYVVIDSVLGWLINMQPAFQQMGWESVATFCGIVRHVLPNFAMMNDMALASLLTLPIFDPVPFAVALAWLLGCFGVGYWIFNRRDY